MADNTEGV